MNTSSGFSGRDIGASNETNGRSVTPSLRVADYPRRHAIVVGVRDYTEGLLPLVNAVNDACLINQILKNEYNFATTLLACPDDVASARFEAPFMVQGNIAGESMGNGSREDILDAIDRVSKVSSPADLFVFYYSGHGVSGHGVSAHNGYMVPYGAVQDRPESYLMYAALYDALSRLPSQHQVIIFDCCFSGTATLCNAYLQGAVESRLLNELCPPELCMPAGAIDLRPQRFIMSVTDDESVTPDAFLAWHDNQANNAGNRNRDLATPGMIDSFVNVAGTSSKNSPFTHALATVLTALAAGHHITPVQLFTALSKQMKTYCCPDIGVAPPRHFTAGVGTIALVRPGIQITSPSETVVATAGKRCQFKLTAQGPKPYEWTLDSSIPDGVSICGNSLLVHLDSRGSYPVTLAVENRALKLSTTKEIFVHIVQEDPRPLAIATEHLTPCIIGEGYHFQFEGDGGVFPIRWKFEDLPAGLRGSSHGYVHGLIRVEKEIAFRKAVHLIEATAQDANNHEVKGVFALAIIDKAKYCEIPAGYFRMGYCPDTEQREELTRLGIEAAVRDIAGNYPAGECLLNRYFIKKTAVTEREWRAFLEVVPYTAAGQPTHWNDAEFSFEKDRDRPVTGISDKDIQAYCEAKGTRLPTGPEWEKAARGVNGLLFPWGNLFDHNKCNNKHFDWNQLTHVEQFPQGASPWGVLDLVGNAWEWVCHRLKRGQTWQQTLRGGSYKSPLYDLVCCTGSAPEAAGIRLDVDGRSGTLFCRNDWTSNEVGFRDVIEVDGGQAYPQGMVRLGKSIFRIPNTNKAVRNTPEVDIARYAVSNLEYLEFIRDTGYPIPCHWNAKNNEPFPFSDRFKPVVNVSYEDASAFCEWKSDKLGRKVKIVTNQIWLAAVHGPAFFAQNVYHNNIRPREYPWGDVYEPFRCNSCETGLGGVTAVFSFPDGRSACGCYNLVGNVAEWGTPRPDGAYEVLGGSWEDQCSDPKVWLQTCRSPRYDIGFRYFSKEL